MRYTFKYLVAFLSASHWIHGCITCARLICCRIYWGLCACFVSAHEDPWRTNIGSIDQLLWRDGIARVHRTVSILAVRDRGRVLRPLRCCCVNLFCIFLNSFVLFDTFAESPGMKVSRIEVYESMNLDFMVLDREHVATAMSAPYIALFDTFTKSCGMKVSRGDIGCMEPFWFSWLLDVGLPCCCFVCWIQSCLIPSEGLADTFRRFGGVLILLLELLMLHPLFSEGEIQTWDVSDIAVGGPRHERFHIYLCPHTCLEANLTFATKKICTAKRFETDQHEITGASGSKQQCLRHVQILFCHRDAKRTMIHISQNWSHSAFFTANPESMVTQKHCWHDAP